MKPLPKSRCGPTVDSGDLGENLAQELRKLDDFRDARVILRDGEAASLHGSGGGERRQTRKDHLGRLPRRQCLLLLPARRNLPTDLPLHALPHAPHLLQVAEEEAAV